MADDSDEVTFEKTVLAVYSFKEKFNDERKQEFYDKILYKIREPELAGLNTELTSYANVADIREYSFNDLLTEAQYLGELSIKDSLGVIAKYNEYHSS